VAFDPNLNDTDAPWIRHEEARTTFRVAAYTGWINLTDHQAQVSTPSAVRAPSAVERTLAYILMQTLPREANGLLLHAAGIVLDGQGYVFTGPSAAGKTTVARLAAGYAEVLSDENVVVRETSGPGVENRLSETEKWPFGYAQDRPQPLGVGPAGPFQFQPVGFQPPVSGPPRDSCHRNQSPRRSRG